MISVFLKEQKKYTEQEIKKVLFLNDCSGNSKNIFLNLINKLLKHGIIKISKANEDSDLSEILYEETANELNQENNLFYLFDFVGVVIVDNYILKIYPKYISCSNKPINELKLILKVLKKYKSDYEKIDFSTNLCENQSTNLIPLMLAIIKDYFENGTYWNDYTIFEKNGNGEIQWDKTVNDVRPIIYNEKPYYEYLITKRKRNNDMDYIKRLHCCIITEIIQNLEKFDLLNLFDLTYVEISDENIDEFGDEEYILNKLEKEIDVQFNTRKNDVLRMMYMYIAMRKYWSVGDSIVTYGTNAFNMVWEKVCAEVLHNQLNYPLFALNLNINENNKYYKLIRNRLIDIIEKPAWIGKSDNGSDYVKKAGDTLIPDIVSIYKEKNITKFIIFDAKYYVLQFEAQLPLAGQPGIESITKQYLYQLAFNNFIQENNISEIYNCFIFPTDGNAVIDKGYVQLKMMKELGLENIDVKLLPASQLYSAYINDKVYDIKNIY